MRPGAVFDRAIEDALERSWVVIVLWSRASVESDWYAPRPSQELGVGY